VHAISGDMLPINRSILGSATRTVTCPGQGGRRNDPYKNFAMEVKMLKWARKKRKKQKSLCPLHSNSAVEELKDSDERERWRRVRRFKEVTEVK
jgi:hypothetical protein